MTGYVDIGNSDTKFAIDSPWQEIARFSTAEISLATLNELINKPLTKLMVASVVPSANDVINVWATNQKIDVVFISHEQDIVSISTDSPHEVGADIIAAAAAVIGDCLVVDAGTATTISYVEDSTLRGVAIAPGPKTQMNSLISSTSLLQDAVLQPRTDYFGTSTPTALASGIVQGQVAWIEHVALQHPYHTVIVTGGFGGLLSASMTIDHVYDPFVVFKGLQVIENGTT